VVQREPHLLIARDVFDEFVGRRKPPPTPGAPGAPGCQPPFEMSPHSAAVIPQPSTAETPDRPRPRYEVALQRKAAAAILGVHPDTVNRWRRKGQLKATPEGLIPLSEIERIRAESTAASGVQLDLLSGPKSDKDALTGEASSTLTPSWSVLVRLLEASHERETKLLEMFSRREAQLTEQLNTVSALLKRAIELLPHQLVDPERSDTIHSSVEPAEDSLLSRVLDYVRQTTGSDSRRRGIRSWQIQQGLNLPRRPNRELSKLADRKLIHRIRTGVYTANPLKIEEKSQKIEKEGTDNE
jgi:hypothetical protein